MIITQINDLLFTEKYRPKTLDEVIIPDRIRNLLDKGMQTNMIFTGSAGCGKTSCARILSEKHPHEIYNSKLGVEVVRTKVDSFCRKLIPFADPNQIKVVYFEEFDRATHQMQEELKSFIEEHSERVRFLATCNNIQEINEPIQSRFNIVDFTPSNNAETIELKKQYARRIISITEQEGIKIPKEEIKQIIINRFPDFRKIWQDIQYYHLAGTSNSSILTNGSSQEEELFQVIFSNKSSVEIWDYLNQNWMDKVNVGFVKLGRPFFNWVKINKPGYVNKLGDALITISEYSDVRLPQAKDGFITLNALVNKLQKIFE